MVEWLKLENTRKRMVGKDNQQTSTKDLPTKTKAGKIENDIHQSNPHVM